eukprot:349593-Chlamydomonas_euryale.AAC.1
MRSRCAGAVPGAPPGPGGDGGGSSDVHGDVECYSHGPASGEHAGYGAARAVPGARTLSFLHFNDVYNISASEQEPVGGAARMATVVSMLGLGRRWGTGRARSAHGDGREYVGAWVEVTCVVLCLLRTTLWSCPPLAHRPSDHVVRWRTNHLIMSTPLAHRPFGPVLRWRTHHLIMSSVGAPSI